MSKSLSLKQRRDIAIELVNELINNPIFLKNDLCYYVFSISSDERYDFSIKFSPFGAEDVIILFSTYDGITEDDLGNNRIPYRKGAKMYKQELLDFIIRELDRVLVVSQKYCAQLKEFKNSKKE